MKKLNSVLVIDDSFTDFFIIKRLLAKIGLCDNLFYKENGEDALSFLANYLREFYNNLKIYGDKYPPLLVLLDINMPRMNGFEFLERLKKLAINDPEKIVRIIMYSTSDSKQDMERAYQYEAVMDYIVKPLDSDSLSRVLERNF